MLKEIEKHLSQRIDATKRSIIYDLNKKTDEIKNMIVCTMGRTSDPENLEQGDGLHTVLPIATLDAFLEFDESIKNDPEKARFLVMYYHNCCCYYC